jgi:hypothetical protein
MISHERHHTSSLEFIHDCVGQALQFCVCHVGIRGIGGEISGGPPWRAVARCVLGALTVQVSGAVEPILGSRVHFVREKNRGQ